MMVGFGENASEKVFMSCDGFWNLRCFLFFSFLFFSLHINGRIKKGTILNTGRLSSFCLDSLYLSLHVSIANGGTINRPLSDFCS